MNAAIDTRVNGIGNGPMPHTIEACYAMRAHFMGNCFGSCLIFLLVLKMCEKEAVLSALNAIIALNGEAGASNDSLEAMLTGVLEGRGKAAFDCLYHVLHPWLFQTFQQGTTPIGKNKGPQRLSSSQTADHTSYMGIVCISSWTTENRTAQPSISKSPPI